MNEKERTFIIEQPCIKFIVDDAFIDVITLDYIYYIFKLGIDLNKHYGSG